MKIGLFTVLQQRGLQISPDNLECAANSIAQASVSQAWNGYDVWTSNIWAGNGDSGKKDLIFKVECLAPNTETGEHHKYDDGYYDFSTVQLDLSCSSTFVTKSVSSLKEYVEERGGSDEWGSSFSADVEADATIKGLNVGMILALVTSALPLKLLLHFTVPSSNPEAPQSKGFTGHPALP